MAKYIVKVTRVQGMAKKTYKCGAVVTDEMFPEGNAALMAKAGYLQVVVDAKEKAVDAVKTAESKLKEAKKALKEASEENKEAAKKAVEDAGVELEIAKDAAKAAK